MKAEERAVLVTHLRSCALRKESKLSRAADLIEADGEAIRLSVESLTDAWGRIEALEAALRETLCSFEEDCGSLDIAPMSRGITILQRALHPPTEADDEGG